MTINSSRKGKVGEREAALFLRTHGFEARRGQQHAGGPDSPDVVHDIDGIHLEVKRVEKLRIYEALEQADRDSAVSDMPVVLHRRNRKPWVVIMYGGDFLELVGRRDNA